MSRKRQVTPDHYVVQLGRSTVLCRCGWVVKKQVLKDTEKEDQDELRELHAAHVVKRARGDR